MRVVVIGAGVAGCATAFRLATLGVTTTLVDAGLTGRASMAAAGIVSPVGPSAMPDSWYRLAFRATAHYHDLVDRLSALGISRNGYAQVGGLVAATRPDDDLDEFIDRATRMARRHGDRDVGQVERLDPDSVPEHVPWLRSDLATAYLPGMARVDAPVLRSALESAAVRSGCTLVLGYARLATRGSSATGVLVGAEQLPADRVVVAAGAWAPALAPAEPPETVQAQRGELVRLSVNRRRPAQLPVVNTFAGRYLVGYPRGRVSVGATRELVPTSNSAATADGVRSVLHDVLEMAPGLRDARFVGVRAGLRPVTPSGLPYLGPDPAVANLYHVGGLGAWGLTVGPFLGHVCGSLVAGGNADPADLDAAAEIMISAGITKRHRP